MRILKPIIYFILLATVLIGCTNDNNSSKTRTEKNGYDVIAHFEFSSGEVVDFKANSLIPMPEPFINEKNNGERIITAFYETIIDKLVYRLEIKTVIKEEPGSYDMYVDDENYLETPGFYIELTIRDEAQTGSTNDLYRTQYINAESGNLKITSITNKRLKGTFSADIPYMPLEEGKNLKITDGKIDIAIEKIDE